jgi:hypothetical protein
MAERDRPRCCTIRPEYDVEAISELLKWPLT